MKFKQIVLLSAILLLPQIASSQAAIVAMIFGDKVASEKFNLSLELGAPFNSFSGVDDTQLTSGVNFGMAGNLMLSENWFLSPTVFFLSKKNFEINDATLNSSDPYLNSLYTNTTANISINYTDVYVMLAYQPTNTNLRFGISPQVSFMKKANATYLGDIGTFDESFTRYVNDMDYGVMANIGYFFRQGHKGKGIHANFRYYYGFADIFNDEFATGTNKNSYFSFHVSLPFITDELAAKNLPPVN